MSFRWVGRLAAVIIPALLCVACGQVYRPVVIPCSVGNIPGCPIETAPTPSSFHAVYGLYSSTPNDPGGIMQIDVAGDSILAETPTSDPSAPNLGAIPTYAAILPNFSRVFVASVGSVAGGLDDVSSFSPAPQTTFPTGFGPVASPTLPAPSSAIAAISEAGNVVTVTLNQPLNIPVNYWVVISGVVIPGCTPAGQPPLCNPNAYEGGFAITANTGTTIQYTDSATGLPAVSSVGIATFPPQPVFLSSPQSFAVYVANYNSDSVSLLSPAQNTVTNSIAVGPHPVSLAETPNGLKIYVANQGDSTNPDGSVSSLNTIPLSLNTVTGFTGINPVWVVARGDSQKVYVLTQGDGQLVTINEATDTVASSLTVGAGANYIFFDPHLNRLYVTNPLTSMVYVFSDTGGPGDTPVQLAAISFGPNSAACPDSEGCVPTSVTALPDGSRFYVASYQAEPSCPDAVVGTASSCVIPNLTVFNATSFGLQYPAATTQNPYAPMMRLLTAPFETGQYALPTVTSCVSPALYAPGTNRFRVFTTAAADSSHVYVSLCDGGAIADINTSGANINGNGGSGSGTPADALITDLPTAYGICTQASCSSVASITGFSINSNIVTFQAANQFAAGQSVGISGLTTGAYLDGLNLTVLATGLSSTQFECSFTYTNVSSTPDSGSAVPATPLQTPIVLLTGQ